MADAVVMSFVIDAIVWGTSGVLSKTRSPVSSSTISIETPFGWPGMRLATLSRAARRAAKSAAESGVARRQTRKAAPIRRSRERKLDTGKL
jgi:hypothetical protein